MKPLNLCVLLLVLALLEPAFAQQQKRKKKPSGANITWVTPESDEYGELPTGAVHKTMASKAAGQDVGYTIYLPPSFDIEYAFDGTIR